MRPAAFQYESPETLAEAISLLAGSDGRAKPIAGGQSLVPMMNLRLARPKTLVSLHRIGELTRVAQSATELRIGAGICHAAIEDGRLPDSTLGYLPYVARGIAYRAIRNRGTVGGSLCHADPAADWITALSALGARCEVRGSSGKRSVAVEEFVVGPLVSALEQDELLVNVEIPKLSRRARWAYVKCCRKVGEFAKSICAVIYDPERGYGRVVVGATDGAPVLLTRTAAALDGGDVANLQTVAREEVRQRLDRAEPAQLLQHGAMVQKALSGLAEQRD